jgi:hypothetical protein
MRVSVTVPLAYFLRGAPNNFGRTLDFLAVMRIRTIFDRIRIRLLKTSGPDPDLNKFLANENSRRPDPDLDPTKKNRIRLDPDPQHCVQGFRADTRFGYPYRWYGTGTEKS